MQVLVFVALFAFSQATLPFSIPTGDSSQYKSEDNFGNYNFGYDESHISGGSFRKEAGDAYGNKYGSYGLTEADGRTRVVNYVADAGGFRADIKTNEPGIESKDPAATSINKAFYSSSYIAPAAPTTYAIASEPVKTYSYAAAPVATTYKTYAAAPVATTYKTYAAAPVATTYKTYEAAPVATTYKTYAAAPVSTSYKTYAAAPVATTYKTYAAAPVATTYKTFASAPTPYSYTYSAAAAPFSYGIAPAAYKVASGPAFTYAAAPAPFNAYEPARFYTGASYIK